MDAPETVSQDAELLRTNLLDGDFARTDFLLNRINIYFSHNAEHRDRTGTDFASAVGINFLRGFMNVSAQRKVYFLFLHQFQDIFLPDQPVAQPQNGMFFKHRIVRQQDTRTLFGTGANDSRFAGIVSNDSGCCGAALSRGRHLKGEMYGSIKHFTWWFVKEFDRYADGDDTQDFDMHFLCALTAPRPLLIASASEDVRADPFNEFRSALAVTPLYRLFGAEGMPDDAEFPAPNHAIFGDKAAYELRDGSHDVQLYDWQVVAEYIHRNRIPGEQK